MSVPVRQRIDQIRVDLERARWVMHDLPSRYVIVNISSAQLYLVEGYTISWRARCQVGKVARKTPIFRAEMTHLVFNPTWTVPPGILGKDILPAARRGEPVVQRKKLKIIDRKGRVVELKFFGGLSVEEIAEALEISAVTVMREWSMAKAWLYNSLNNAS